MADENTPEQQEKINKLLENAKKSLKEQVNFLKLKELAD